MLICKRLRRLINGRRDQRHAARLRWIAAARCTPTVGEQHTTDMSRGDREVTDR